jgi:hypothetical protein
MVASECGFSNSGGHDPETYPYFCLSLPDSFAFGANDEYPTLCEYDNISLHDMLCRLYENRTVELELSGGRKAYVSGDAITIYGRDYDAEDIRKIYQAHERIQKNG